MDRYVQGRYARALKGEFIPFVLNTGVHYRGCHEILRVTRAAQKTFGDTVLSLATTPEYRILGIFA
jgi:hypothetical protein